MTNNYSIQSIPKELVASIAVWLPTVDFIQFARVSKITRKILNNHTTILDFISQRRQTEQEQKEEERKRIPDNVENLEQLGFFERIRDYGLINENRIGFDYASTEIEEDEGDPDPGSIKNSQSRIQFIKDIMETFSSNATISIVIDAHCGTLAPTGIAGRFSRARGLAVVRALMEDDDEIITNNNNNSNHIIFNIEEEMMDGLFKLRSWGRKITNIVSESKHHPYGDLARQGKGWVEIYLRIGRCEFPQRPDFYNEQ